MESTQALGEKTKKQPGEEPSGNKRSPAKRKLCANYGAIPRTLVLFGAAAVVPVPVPGPVIVCAPICLWTPPWALVTCQEFPWRRVAKLGRSRCPRAVDLLGTLRACTFCTAHGGGATWTCAQGLRTPGSSNRWLLPFAFSHLLACFCCLLTQSLAIYSQLYSRTLMLS